MKAHILPCLSCLVLVLFSKARADLANDLLQSTQTWGAAQIDRSVIDRPLSIAGIHYERGIGSHAVSDIPLSIPDKAVELTGLVGMDDGAADGNGEARFRILSGSAILWESPKMKQGTPAAAFQIKIPAQARRLYLIVDDLGDNSFDHADWVDLKWKFGTPTPSAAPARLKASDFGIKVNDRSDQSAAMRRAIDALRAAPGSTLVLEKGAYHFWHTGAVKRHFHASNHDQPTWRPISIPLVDLNGATIEGNGSLFLFHGEVQPFLIQDSENVTLEGIAVDYEIPHHSQLQLTKVDADAYEFTVDQKQYPHRVENGWLTFTGEGWEVADRDGGIVFDGKTREIVAGTSDHGYRGKLTRIADGHYRVERDLKKSGIKAGDVLTVRHGHRRPLPAMVLYRAKDTTLVDFIFHCSDGMGLLAQRSENIHLKGGGVFPRGSTGRYFSTTADATHFSNCRGSLITEGSLYSGMMDDAINVHATCMRIIEKRDPRTIRCQFVHGQSYGFEIVMPGETINFIQAKWLTPRDPRQVEKVDWINSKELLITLTEPMPADLGVGDAIENADWHASVLFKGNTVRHNRARGALFTTPRPIVVEDNTFDTIAGSAILLAGDANGWYESGACHDVLIRKNLFRNNLTSRFQFTEALISIFPEIPDLKGQTDFYHRNIRIEDNVFETFDVPLLFAISTDGIRFTGNQVSYNSSYPAWKKPAFILRRCKDIEVSGNKLSNPPRPWTLESDFDLQLTPTEEIRLIR